MNPAAEPPAEPPTPGQLEGAGELRAVQALTAGGIRVTAVAENVLANGYLPVDVTVDCRRPDDWRPLRPLDDTEPVIILVPPRYPLQQPFVVTRHQRFAGLPHVVWAETICLHQAENDWDPGRGMHGLIERLIEWFRRVADGTLATADPVLEPPITERSRARAQLIVRPDLPRHLAADPGPWIAMAVVEAVGSGTYEVRDWLAHADPMPAAGGRTFLAPVLGLPDEVGFSYPRTWGGLLGAVEKQRIRIPEFYAAVRSAADQNARLWTAGVHSDARPLTLVLMVSPAGGPRSARSRSAYLAAWTDEASDGRLPLGARTAPVAWLPVYDQRPAHTVRRDTTRPASWLWSRRVLLLGCGGLGAPIAEYCVRAGAAVLHLVDKSVVRPGVLVRQPYHAADIGGNKAVALARHLAGAGARTTIEPVDADAVEAVMTPGGLPDADLIVDATAAHTVGAALERTRWERGGPHPPLLSVAVGHDCSMGVATLALPGANGAGNDILRRLAVAAGDDDDLTDVLDEFHPHLPRTELFVPEPGCSDPTYRGSAADLAYFASALLNEALTLLAEDRHPATPLRWATVVRAGVTDRRHWREPVRSVDTRNHYDVRIDPRAFAAVRREVIRMAEDRGPELETGGLLLGRIDPAARVAWVTEAQGLPPGSTASAEALVLDPAGVRAHTDERLHRTRRLVEFIGAWHTHPWSVARPSADDHRAMAEMATKNGAPVLMVIFGDDGANGWARWIGGLARPGWYARIYFPEPGEEAR